MKIKLDERTLEKVNQIILISFLLSIIRSRYQGKHNHINYRSVKRTVNSKEEEQEKD
jgi:hypothetical protein